MKEYNLRPKIKGIFKRRTVYQVVMRHTVNTHYTRNQKIITYANTVVFESESLPEAAKELKSLRGADK